MTLQHNKKHECGIKIGMQVKLSIRLLDWDIFNYRDKTFEINQSKQEDSLDENGMSKITDL